jgi:catechol 2,3-dioxygenase-like lactoylglutathione lyase family enzyme
VPVIHHAAVCVADVEASLRFWRDGLGFAVVMDGRFDGDWPTLLRAPTPSLRAVFLGDPARPEAGIVELVDLGDVPEGERPADRPAASGFLLLSVMVPDVEAALARLADLGLGGDPRRVDAMGIAMAVVVDPDGVQVELVEDRATANLERLTASGGDA